MELDPLPGAAALRTALPPVPRAVRVGDVLQHALHVRRQQRRDRPGADVVHGGADRASGPVELGDTRRRRGGTPRKKVRGVFQGHDSDPPILTMTTALAFGSRSRSAPIVGSPGRRARRRGEPDPSPSSAAGTRRAPFLTADRGVRRPTPPPRRTVTGPCFPSGCASSARGRSVPRVHRPRGDDSSPPSFVAQDGGLPDPGQDGIQTRADVFLRRKRGHLGPPLAGTDVFLLLLLYLAQALEPLRLARLRLLQAARAVATEVERLIQADTAEPERREVLLRGKRRVRGGACPSSSASRERRRRPRCPPPPPTRLLDFVSPRAARDKAPAAG